MQISATEQKKISTEIKNMILETVEPKNVGHITSSFSSVEILYALYKTANINKKNAGAKLRDRVIISKEHCRAGQVCVLAHLGLLDKKILKTYCHDQGLLGHDIYNIVGSKEIAAVDIASGSLGHGPGVGAGMALGDKDHHIYVLCGDGELQEGSTYEAFIFISQHKIKNITIIIDRNNMQIDNYTKNIIDTSSNLIERMSHLGFEVLECDGHDISDIEKALKVETKVPKCIVANTGKGNGMECLLDKGTCAYFHHSAFTKEEINQAWEGN